MATGFYAGSFDPLTLGHLDVIETSLVFLDKLVVGLGVHHEKNAMISARDRGALVIAAAKGKGIEAHKMDIITFDGLSVEAARAQKADILVRGLRDSDDFAYEMRTATMNQTLDVALKTLFIPASQQHRYISSTVVRQIYKMGGDISGFVPTEVAQFLKAR